MRSDVDSGLRHASASHAAASTFARSSDSAAAARFAVSAAAACTRPGGCRVSMLSSSVLSVTILTRNRSYHSPRHHHATRSGLV
jgi:hypothetical protein